MEDFEALCGFRAPAVSADAPGRVRGCRAGSRGEVLRMPDPRPRCGPRSSCSCGGPADRAGRWCRPSPSRGQASRGTAGLRAGRGPRRAYPATWVWCWPCCSTTSGCGPDEAVFMPAGNLHAYLRRRGCRDHGGERQRAAGGLTAQARRRRRAAADAALRGTRRTSAAGHGIAPGVIGWPAPVEEFSLFKAAAAVCGERGYRARPGPRILLCVAGPARCQAGGSTLVLRPGEAAFVGALSRRPSSRRSRSSRRRSRHALLPRLTPESVSRALSWPFSSPLSDWRGFLWFA